MSNITRNLPSFRKIYYMKGVNMLYSFKTLEKIAQKMRANLQEGDVLIVDNTKGTRRKAFFKTANDSLIVYGDKKSKFAPLSNRKTSVRTETKPLLEFFLKN